MKTINLSLGLSFEKALEKLVAGECLGIRPGNNVNYVEICKGEGMSSNTDYLRWRGGGNRIRLDQFTGIWYAVIVNHRDLMEAK